MNINEPFLARVSEKIGSILGSTESVGIAYIWLPLLCSNVLITNNKLTLNITLPVLCNNFIALYF